MNTNNLFRTKVNWSQIATGSESLRSHFVTLEDGRGLSHLLQTLQFLVERGECYFCISTTKSLFYEMKKALIIISILISVLLMWYYYTIEEVKTEVIAPTEIDEDERELEFDRRFAELTNDNRDYAFQLIRVGKKHFNNKEYLKAEACFRGCEGLKLSKGWLMGDVDSNFIDYYHSRLDKISMMYAYILEKTDRVEEALNAYIGNDKPMNAVKVYEKGGRIEKALSLLLNKRDAYLKGLDCGTCSLSYLSSSNKKLIEFCFKLQKFDTAFTIYMDNINSMHSISDDTLTTIIKTKLSKLSIDQKDSILKAAYKSLKVSKNENDFYSTQFYIFGKEIYYYISTDNDIKVKNVTQAKQSAWDDFKRTRLYELLAERK